MLVIERPEQIQSSGLIGTIGFFDGVHLGHLSLINSIIKIAAQKHLKSSVITFRTHPGKILHPNTAPSLINSFEEKLERLSQTGIDYCIVLDFTAEVSRLSAYDFLQYLATHFNIKCLLVGYDHRFGHNRSAGFEDYVNYGKQLGVEVLCANPYSPDGSHISSSVIRLLLEKGEVADAARLLSYYYSLRGEVVHGYRLGREMGFPTANLRVSEDSGKLIPAQGVYAVRVKIGKIYYGGMLNIGTRPTIQDGGALSLEVNIFDFSGDLYGQYLDVEFVAYLRPEVKLPNIKALTEQMKKDKENATSILLQI